MLADSEQSKESRIVRFERAGIMRVFLGPRITRANEDLIREHSARHTPEVPVFKRRIDDAEAKEEHVGFEQIHSFEQLKYWADRCLRS